MVGLVLRCSVDGLAPAGWCFLIIRAVGSSTPSKIRFSLAAVLWFGFARSADAQTDEACADARRLAVEQHDRASKTWDKPVLEEAVFVFTQLLELCPTLPDRLDILFWRGGAYHRLYRPKEAAADYDVVAASIGPNQCGAINGAIGLWKCLDDRHFDGGDPKDCILLKLRPRSKFSERPPPPPDPFEFIGELPAWPSVRLPLAHQAQRVVELAKIFERECEPVQGPGRPIFPNLVYWRVAQIHRRYGHEEDFYRALCKLAVSYPSTLQGEQAALLLAGKTATCSSE
jgi:hypothetical protein